MQVEQITFERTGGFAGMHIRKSFKPNDLPPEQAEELLEILDELDLDEIPEQATNNPALPDQFTYRITVETKDGEHHIVTGDRSTPEKLRELVEILNRIARKPARKD